MIDRYPPRIATAIERDKAVGCRATSVWLEDLDAMADRSARAESTAQQLDIVVHDAMHIIIGLTKALSIYAPAVGKGLKADADSIFARWTEVRAALMPTTSVESETATQDMVATGTAVFTITADGLKRIDPQEFFQKSEESKDHG